MKYLQQEVVGIVPMVDGGDGVQDSSSQAGGGALQEYRLEHLGVEGIVYTVVCTVYSFKLISQQIFYN